MKFAGLEKNSIVQIVTDYALQRIGKIESINEDSIKLIPEKNENLLPLLHLTEEELKQRPTFSIEWPIIIATRNIKEIIILKNVKNNIKIKSKKTE